MQQSKFIFLLKSLSKREQSKYRDLIFSPFFNKNKKVRQLVDICLQNAPDFEADVLQKQSLFPHLFGQSPYNELKINNVISDALQLLYRYFGQMALQKDEIKLRPFIIEELLERNQAQATDQQLKRYQQELEPIEQQSETYYFQWMHLSDLRDRWSLMYGARDYSHHLQQKNDALDQYYWCSKLRLACDMESRNKVINAHYRAHFLEDILHLYEAGHPVFDQQAVLKIYYKTLQMLRYESEESHYHELKQLIAEHAGTLRREELNDLYDYAQNYCVKKINSGQVHFYREILDLYQLMSDKEILLRGGYLSQWSYINIITAGLRLKEYEWTEQFIYQYREYLPDEVKNNVFTYNLAALYFEKGAFHTALQTLQDVEFSDPFFHMSAKIIQLKSYFELRETEAFFSLVEATRKYIRRNRRLSDYQIKSNSNFIKLVARLYRLKTDVEYLPHQKYRERLHGLEQDISKGKEVVNIGWLMQKLKEVS
ncbi:MAG TPA: hypothetical protein PKA00_18625 [Saprospiraceae bacterium]|nr:hypothetical protein [Saprospiraceae bacterium]HMQ84935.1 hypothetical protein [Saprospiraceae bacterium]